MSKPEPAQVLYTIGHGSHTTDAFLELLQSVNAQSLVDVRAHPHSRRHPQFERNRLLQALADAGVVYHWAGHELGGFRQGRLDSPHSAFRHASLRAYADHMDTDEFQIAAFQLIRLARETPTALMCAEKQPTYCHRSLIADYRVLNDIRVFHLIDPDNIVEHQLNPLVRRDGDRLIYDLTTQGKLELKEGI